MLVNDQGKNRLKKFLSSPLQRALTWDRLQFLGRLLQTSAPTSQPLVSLSPNSQRSAILALALLTIWPLATDSLAQRQSSRPVKSPRGKPAAQEIKNPLEQAEALMKKGWVLDAIKAYQQALAQDPQNLSIRKSLALAEEKQGRTAQAIKAFEAVLALVPDDQDALGHLGVLYARNRATWPQAITALTTVLTNDNDNSSMRKLLADLYYWMGEYPNAERNYLALLAGQPENAEIVLSLAQVLTWQQRGSEALPLFAKAQLLNAKFTETAQYARALATFQTEDYVAAERAYLQLANNFPKVAKYRAELKKIRQAVAEAQAQTQEIAGANTTATSVNAASSEEPNATLPSDAPENLPVTNTPAVVNRDLVSKQNLKEDGKQSGKENKSKDSKDSKASKDPLILAEELMNKGWVLGAVDAYQKALAKEPQSLRARKGLALAEEKQGRAPQAIKAFEAVLELDPNDGDALGRLGTLYARNKKTWPQAISSLTSALTSDSGNFVLRKLLADVYNWSGEYPDAERNYLILLNAQPENPELTLSLAQVMTWQQRGSEALGLFAKAQRLNAKFTETAQYARALAIFQAEDYATAERAYLQLTKDFPKVEKYRVELEKVRTAIVTLPQRHLDERLNVARTDFNNGDYDRAFAEFNRVLVDSEFSSLLADKENATKIRLEYADLLSSRPDRIKDAISQLDLIEPQSAEVALKREEFATRLLDERLNLARMDFNNGNYDRAFAEFGRVLAEKESTTLRLEYADLLSSRPERLKDAINQLDLIRPQTAALDLKRARLLTRLPEKRSQAIQLYLRLRGLNPEDVEIKQELIKVLGWIELDETVALVAAELVAHDPDAKSLRLPVIRYYMQIGRPEPTIALLQLLINENSQEVEPHLLLARAYFLTNRKPESRREYETVLQLDMNNAEANEQVGWFTLQAGDPQRALTRFESAIELAPQAVTPKIGRINALLALREHVAAERQLRAISVKDDPLVDDVRDRIKEGLAIVNVENAIKIQSEVVFRSGQEAVRLVQGGEQRNRALTTVRTQFDASTRIASRFGLGVRGSVVNLDAGALGERNGGEGSFIFKFLPSDRLQFTFSGGSALNGRAVFSQRLDARVGERGSFFLQFARNPVTESFLSYQGVRQIDGSRIGRIMATGVSAGVTVPITQLTDISLRAKVERLKGENIAANNRREFSFVIGREFKDTIKPLSRFDYFRVGLQLTALNFTRDLNTVPIGIGAINDTRDIPPQLARGYFSPDYFLAPELRLDFGFRSLSDRLKVNTGIGLSANISRGMKSRFFGEGTNFGLNSLATATYRLNNYFSARLLYGFSNSGIFFRENRLGFGLILSFDEPKLEKKNFPELTLPNIVVGTSKINLPTSLVASEGLPLTIGVSTSTPSSVPAAPTTRRATSDSVRSEVFPPEQGDILAFYEPENGFSKSKWGRLNNANQPGAEKANTSDLLAFYGEDRVRARNRNSGNAGNAAERYTIFIESFTEEMEAKLFLQQLQTLGFNPYIIKVNAGKKGGRYQIRLGEYAASADAKRIAGFLIDKGFEALVVLKDN